jgi:Mrp family chromosome partitioning ATPase
MAVALDAARQTHDVVIVDLPSILVSSDALTLVDLVDGLIFVVRTGSTPAPLIAKALAQFDRAKLRGLVLNDVHTATPTPVERLFGR